MAMANELNIEQDFIFDSQMQDWWFEQAIRDRPYITRFMTLCAKEGKIDHLKENLSYFETDLFVDIVESMRDMNLMFDQNCPVFKDLLLENIKSRIQLLAEPCLAKAQKILNKKQHRYEKLLPKRE